MYALIFVSIYSSLIRVPTHSFQSSAENPALGREIFQLCCAIEDIAVHDATLWKALVDAGITDSLCEAVCTLKLQHTDDYTLGEKTRAIINYTVIYVVLIVANNS